MIVNQLTLCIRKLRFDPYTEFDSIFLSRIGQPLNTIRQLFRIYHPIAQRRVVIYPAIFPAKPAIVHHKKLTSHRSNVVHHLVHLRFFNIQIYTFPTIEQDIPWLVATVNHTCTCPPMEITAGTANTFLRISQRQYRSSEYFFRFQFILGSFFIHSGKNTVYRSAERIIHIHSDLSTSAPAKCCTNYTATIFLRLAIKRKHHFRMITQPVADTIHILNHFHSGNQRLTFKLCLSSPMSVQRRYPYIRATNQKMTGVKAFKYHRLFLVVRHLHPCFYHIYLLISLIVHFYSERIYTVFHRNHSQYGILHRILFDLVDN